MVPWPADRREKALARVAKAPGAILNPPLSREVSVAMSTFRFGFRGPALIYRPFRVLFL